jgi:integrase/recombinase XerD
MVHIPVITVFVRHGVDCPHFGDEFFKRCQCWKHLRWTEDGRQLRKASKQRTWAGAERVKREMELSFENAAAGKPAQSEEAVSVERAVSLFLADKQGQNVSGGVEKKYRRELDRFVRFCEQRHRHFLAGVTAADVTEFRGSWQKEYPSSLTRQQVQARLKSFFRYASNLGWIHKNPAIAMSPIKVDVPPTLPLDEHQYRTLLDRIPDVFRDPIKAARVRAIVQCMRFTGLAIRDAVCLEKSAVQYDARKRITRVVTSRAKTGVDVSVPIPPELAGELRALAGGNPRYVFWHTGNGKPESAVTNWQHDLRELFHESGMPNGHPHQLRDTAAVEWLNAGVPLEEVSRLLGHSSIKTTERHYSPWVRSRQDRLDAVVIATWRHKP